MKRDSTAPHAVSCMRTAGRPGAPAVDGCPGSVATRSAEPHGALILVLEAGAWWPASFEAHRRGHADVAALAQQPNETTVQLFDRVRNRVAELRDAGRCTRTALIVASSSGGEAVATRRALLARTLSASLCPGCGVLQLAPGSTGLALRRQLQALASALGDPPGSVRVQVHDR